jgi:hypothetical protein
MNLRLVFLSALIVTFTATGGAADRLNLNVSPAVAFAPANLTVRATIESDPENHAVTIVAESADFYRSSEIALEGDRAPRTTMLQFRALPTGSYEVKATLFGPDGRPRAIARQQVNVISTPRGDTGRTW